MYTEKNTQKDKLELLFDINERISDISFLFERIDVLADDISSCLYRKTNLDLKKRNIALEDALRITQIKYDILCECTTEIREILPQLLQNADYVYELVKAESKSVQPSS